MGGSGEKHIKISAGFGERLTLTGRLQRLGPCPSDCASEARCGDRGPGCVGVHLFCGTSELTLVTVSDRPAFI